AWQGRGGHVGLHCDRHVNAAGTAAAEFLPEDHGVGVVCALASVDWVVLKSEKPGRAELFEKVMRREDPLGLPLVDERRDVAVDEGPHRGPKELMVGGEFHGVRPLRRSARLSEWELWQ